MRVCLGANVYGYAEGGGHLWEYLNWALGLRSVGCEVLWLERVPGDSAPADVRANVSALEERLAPYGLSDSLVLASGGPEQLDRALLDGARGVGDAEGGRLFLDLA